MEGGGEIQKILKKGWKYGAGAGVLKGGGRLALFLFIFFKDYHVYIYKLLYALQNCVMHWRKIIFFW